MKANYKKTKEGILADFVTQTAEEFQVDITGNYDQWRKLASSLSNTFGEEGRGVFHRLSKLRAESEYTVEKTDKIYNESIKTLNRITFASFMYYAAEAGIKREEYFITYGSHYTCLPFKK